MAGHGAMRFDELSTGDEITGKPKNDTAGNVVAWGAAKPAVAAKAKVDKEVDTAESAAADSELAEKSKTAAAAVVVMTKAAIGAGSTASGNSPPAAKATVKAAVRAGRANAVKPSTTAARGAPEAAGIQVAATRPTPSGKAPTPSGKAPAAALETAVVATAVAVGTGPVALAGVRPAAESEDVTAGDDVEPETEAAAVDPAYTVTYTIVSSKEHTPVRASVPVVGRALRGSPVTAESTYSQIARCGTGGDERDAVTTRSTCASYMAGHGVMRLQELSTGHEVAGKVNGAAIAGDITTPAWGKTATKVKAKAAVAVDTAQPAAVQSAPTKTGKTAAAVVVATTKAATDAGSTTSGDAAPPAEVSSEAVDAVRPIAVEPAPTAAKGVSGVAVVPVAAAPTVVETLLGHAPAMDVPPAATGGLVVVAAGATVDKEKAVATVTTSLTVHSDPVSAVDVRSAAADVDPKGQRGVAAVGTVDYKGQPTAADVVDAEEQGVSTTGQALAQAAVDAASVSVAMETLTATGGGDAVPAEAAVVAVEMVEMWIAVAVNTVSAAGVDGAPVANITVEAVHSGRPTTVDASHTATGGSAGAVAAPVAAVPAAVMTINSSLQVPALDAAPTATGSVEVAVVAGATADQANQAAAMDIATMDNEKAVVEAAIVAIRTDQVSAAGVGPAGADVDRGHQGGAAAVGTADNHGQSAVADVVATREHRVPVMVEALVAVAVDAGEMPAAPQNSAVAGGGGESAAEAAMVAAELVVVSVAVPVDAGSSADENGAPSAKITVEAVNAGRSNGVDTPPTSTEGLARAATVPVAAASAAVVTNSVRELAMDATLAATGVVVVAAATAPAKKTDQAAAIDIAAMDGENIAAAAAAIVAVHTNQASAAGVGPAAPGVGLSGQGGTLAVGTAGDQGQSAVAGVVPAKKQGVPAIVVDAAVGVGEMPAVAENAAVAGGGDAAVAVVVSEVAVVVAAVAFDVVHQSPAEHMIPEMDPGVPEAGDVERQGVPGMVVAFLEAVVDAGEVPAAAENAAIAGGGDAAVAVVALERAVVAVPAEAVDVPQGPAEGMVPDMDPGVPEAGEAEEQGVRGMGEALGEAAVQAGEIPAAAENAAVAGGGGAAAAVVVLQMAVAAVAGAVDEPQGPAEDIVAEVDPVGVEAGEAAGAVAEPAPLAAAAGDRTRRKFPIFHILVYGIWGLVWTLFLVTNIEPVDSISRGNTLSPGDKPLVPGERIEGKGGLHRLGWLFPWIGYTPKLTVSGGGKMIATRPDGSEVVLAGGVPEQKTNRGFLCQAERVVRRVAKVDSPEYGGRSVKGRLVLGREHFCGIDASAAATRTMDLALQWLEGDGESEGVIGFSADGDLEMVTPSGELVWSLAQGHDGDETVDTVQLTKEARKASKEKKMEERRIQAESREVEKLQKAEEYRRRLAETKAERKAAKLRKKEESARRKAEKADAQRNNKDKSNRRRDEKSETKQKEKGRRRSLFGWNDVAAGDAAKDISGSPAQGEPPRQTAFGRIFHPARPPPDGAGGQAR